MSTSRKTHPAVAIVTSIENTWSRDLEQANTRSLLVVWALIDAGIITDAEVFHGLIVVKGSTP